MADTPAAELHEIANAVRDRLAARLPFLPVQVADSRGADIRWIIDQPPAAIVNVPKEEKSKEDRQPLGNAAVYVVMPEVLFCFDGMRPRDDDRTYGWDILALARDAMWGFRINGTIMKTDYLCSEEIGYNEDLNLTFFQMTLKTKVYRVIKPEPDQSGPGDYQDDGQYQGHGGYQG